MGDFGFNIPGVIADTDLSTKQYRAVKMKGTTEVFEVAAITANTDKPIGILQNDPDTGGKAAEVAWGGVSKVVLGGSVNSGDSLSPDTVGELISLAEGTSASADDRFIIAHALQDGSSGEVILALLVSPHIATDLAT